MDSLIPLLVDHYSKLFVINESDELNLIHLSITLEVIELLLIVSVEPYQ